MPIFSIEEAAQNLGMTSAKLIADMRKYEVPPLERGKSIDDQSLAFYKGRKAWAEKKNETCKDGRTQKFDINISTQPAGKKSDVSGLTENVPEISAVQNFVKKDPLTAGFVPSLDFEEQVTRPLSAVSTPKPANAGKKSYSHVRNREPKKLRKRQFHKTSRVISAPPADNGHNEDLYRDIVLGVFGTRELSGNYLPPSEIQYQNLLQALRQKPHVFSHYSKEPKEDLAAALEKYGIKLIFDDTKKQDTIVAPAKEHDPAPPEKATTSGKYPSGNGHRRSAVEASYHERKSALKNLIKTHFGGYYYATTIRELLKYLKQNREFAAIYYPNGGEKLLPKDLTEVRKEAYRKR